MLDDLFQTFRKWEEQGRLRYNYATVQRSSAKMVHGSAGLAKRRFHGLMRPMKLNSSVRMSKKATSSAPCLSEMTAVMACWKINVFDDVPCKKEIQAFVQCAEKVRLNPKALKSENGYRWSTEEVNERLRRFVWAQ